MVQVQKYNTSAKEVGLPIELIEAKNPVNIPKMIKATPYLSKKFKGVDFSSGEQIASIFKINYDETKKEKILSDFHAYVQKKYGEYLLKKSVNYRYSSSKIYSLEELVDNPLKYKDYNEFVNDYNRENKVFISEAFDESKIKTIEKCCKELNIEYSEIFNKLRNYLYNTKNHSLEGFIEAGMNLENSLFKKLYEKVEYRESLLVTIIGKKNSAFTKWNINFKNGEASYRNIKKSSFSKAFPELNSSNLRTIIYKTVHEKGWNVKLPNWFLKSYNPLVDYLRKKGMGENFTSRDLKSDNSIDNNYIYRALNAAEDLGLIEWTKKRDKRCKVFKIINTPHSFPKIKSISEKDGSKHPVNQHIGMLVNTIHYMIRYTQEAYIEKIRGQILDSKKVVAKKLNEYVENFEDAHYDSLNKIREKYSEVIKSVNVEDYNLDLYLKSFNRKKLFTKVEDSKHNQLQELIDYYDKSFKSEFNVDLKEFNYNKDVFKAFYEIAMVQSSDISSALMFGISSFNNYPVKIKATKKFLTTIGDCLIEIQKNPKEGVLNYHKAYEKYVKIVNKL